VADDTRRPAELPIACTLGAADGVVRLAQWRALSDARSNVRRSPGEVVVRYEPRCGLYEELESLVAAERECCAFAEWEVTRDPENVVLRIRADPQGLAAIVDAFRSS
jgi:hypothetical protein